MTQDDTILQILHDVANPACPLQVSMSIHSFDTAMGMSPEACSKRVHMFTVAAQYVLSQDKIDPVLHNEELDSYLFTFGEAQKALAIFSLSKNACSVFSDIFPRKGSVPSKKVRQMLGWDESTTILDR